MKKILFAAIIAALALSFSACTKDTGNKIGSSSDLVGEWELTKVYYIYKIDGKIDDEDTENIPAGMMSVVVNADGTGTMIDSDDEWDITWELSGNKLEVTDDEGYTDEMKVEKLNSSEMVLSVTYHEVYEGVTYDDYERMTFKKK